MKNVKDVIAYRRLGLIRNLHKITHDRMYQFPYLYRTDCENSAQCLEAWPCTECRGGFTCSVPSVLSSSYYTWWILIYFLLSVPLHTWLCLPLSWSCLALLFSFCFCLLPWCMTVCTCARFPEFGFMLNYHLLGLICFCLLTDHDGFHECFVHAFGCLSYLALSLPCWSSSFLVYNHFCLVYVFMHVHLASLSIYVDTCHYAAFELLSHLVHQLADLPLSCLSLLCLFGACVLVHWDLATCFMLVWPWLHCYFLSLSWTLAMLAAPILAALG